MAKLIVVAALIGIMAVAAVTPSHARWYRHRRAHSIVPPGGVIGWSVPFSFNYVGPSYFSNAPVYVLPYSYSPEGAATCAARAIFGKLSEPHDQELNAPHLLIDPAAISRLLIRNPRATD